MNARNTLTVLLDEWRNGDGRALEQVVRTAFADLQRIATAKLRHNSDLTLSPGELLNEALIRLMESSTDFKNRAHFFATISLHMRTVLVDHARARKTEKRGGGAIHVTLGSASQGEDEAVLELIALDEALQLLDQRDPRAAQVLHLTYFAGLDRESIAAVIGVSIPTVDRELRFARAWLAREMRIDHV